jgi:uncharacterized protein (DUF427 family)
MRTTLGPSPGAIRYPQHKVEIRTSNRMWRVNLDGRVLATSNKTLLVEESGYEPVTYFPPQDVDRGSLLESDSRTTCPFKGEAGYFAAMVDGAKIDVAWFYPSVYDEVDKITGYVAFYADRVAIEAEEINEK